MARDHRTRLVELGPDADSKLTWGGVCSCGCRSAPNTNKHTVRIDTNNHLFRLGDDAGVHPDRSPKPRKR